MSDLSLLLELQAIHDYLRTIHRDLNNFPPDLAEVDGRIKSLTRSVEEQKKAFSILQDKHLEQSKILDLARQEEDRSRLRFKQSAQRAQYTASLRELDEKERYRAKAEKEHQALTAQMESARLTLETTEGQLQSARQSFSEMHEVFLSEHATQVTAKETLEAKQIELEAQISAPLLLQFNRLLGARQGKALVPVENGVCSGCRTKLRVPYLSQVREAKVPMICESCQRMIYLPLGRPTEVSS